MKKTYITPAIQLEEALAEQMMAVSIVQTGTADDSEVLAKENDDWDMWEE